VGIGWIKRFAAAGPRRGGDEGRRFENLPLGGNGALKTMVTMITPFCGFSVGACRRFLRGGGIFSELQGGLAAQ